MDDDDNPRSFIVSDMVDPMYCPRLMQTRTKDLSGYFVFSVQ